MNTEERYNVVTSINEVIELFRESPNIFLTEDDLRLHLCCRLLRYFGSVEHTQDGDRSISLHSEVRWYGKDGNLGTRSDIVLIDVSSLDVLRHARLPSKGFGFNIPKAIIELKLRRVNGASQGNFLEEINKDINKLSELKRIFHNAQGRDQTAYWLIILDKKAEVTEEIIAPEGITIHYKYVSGKQHSA
jgi:hypothetical protein